MPLFLPQCPWGQGFPWVPGLLDHPADKNETDQLLKKHLVSSSFHQIILQAANVYFYCDYLIEWQSDKKKLLSAFVLKLLQKLEGVFLSYIYIYIILDQGSQFSSFFFYYLFHRPQAFECPDLLSVQHHDGHTQGR